MPVTRFVLFSILWTVAAATDCKVGGSGLCGCSELIQKRIISSFDDCTQEAAVAACKSGSCKHSWSNFTTGASKTSSRTNTLSGADCTVGGAGLCSCSELMQKHIISSFDDCTQEAAVSACKAGSCAHSDHPVQLSTNALPYSFHNDVGPFDMSWGFPSADTIEIEFSLPSDYYIGLGLTADGVGDAIAGWVDKDGKVHVGDYWDGGSRQPDTDESKGCKNDIEPVSGNYANGVTTVRFRRKLQTGDKPGCDEPILNGPMDINYAWCNPPWCFDYDKGCKAYEDGCIDSPHSLDASAHVTVDFSGKMLSTDVVV